MNPDDSINDWTVMVYLAGENNLAEECVYALKEMKRAMPRLDSRGLTHDTADSNVKVVAQLDASGLGGAEVRYVLRRGDVDGRLRRDVVATRDTSETSYRSVVKDFLVTSVTTDNGLARKYMVVLAGHGAGAEGSFLSRDADPPDALSIPKLQWVFNEARKDIKQELREHLRGELSDEVRAYIEGFDDEDFRFDLLGIDSCLMSMAETCYELRQHVKYLVGAEGFEPNTGWPYERILTELYSNSPDYAHEPGGTAALADKIVGLYTTYYSDYLPAGRSVDLAACDLGRCDDLKRAVAGLAEALRAELKTDDGRRAILLAHWEAQTYKDDLYVDLYDFCNLLSEGPGGDDGGDDPWGTGTAVMRGMQVGDYLKDACREVKRVLRGDEKGAGMILRSCYSGPAVQYSHGLAVYFPWSQVSEHYGSLEFARDTGWHLFLREFVEATRRRVRACAPGVHSELLFSKPGFRTSAGGLTFLPVNDRVDVVLNSRVDVIINSRNMSNKIGSMKNPALAYHECPCGEAVPATVADPNGALALSRADTGATSLPDDGGGGDYQPGDGQGGDPTAGETGGRRPRATKKGRTKKK